MPNVNGIMKCAAECLEYLRDNDSRRASFNELSFVVNYFYHSKIKKSAKQAAGAGV